MKALLAIVLIIACTPPVFAGKVKGYTTKKGTVVAPSYRSKANGTKLDNYSTKGNFNPYNGKAGTKRIK